MQAQSLKKLYLLCAVGVVAVTVFSILNQSPHSEPTTRTSDSEKSHSDSVEPYTAAITRIKGSEESHSDSVAPHSDSEEPHSDSVAPHSDSEEPHSDSVTPHSDSEEPHSDSVAPHSDSVAPHSDSVTPHSDSEEPHSDSATPHSDSEEPHSDSVTPHSDSVAPHSDSTTAEDSVSSQPSCKFMPSDTKAPLCPLCSTPAEKITEVSVYLHDYDGVNVFFGGKKLFSVHERESSSCELSSGVKCHVNHDNPQSDAVVFFTRSQLPSNGPLRYCYPQVVILFNTEVEHPGYDHGYKPYAEVMYDYHLQSDIRYIYPCSDFQIEAARQPPNPKQHSGFAMFISNCGATERFNYLGELMNHIRIDSYGGCHHNMDRKADRYVKNWAAAEKEVLSKYRLAIAYENTISPEYITEKAFLGLSVGVIPVYKGPPEIYLHIPDRHNIINIDDYASPAELAKYLQRVLDEDELYLHHATINMTKVEEYLQTVCSDGPVACQMCEKVYQLKVASLAGGSRACSCAKHTTF